MIFRQKRAPVSAQREVRVSNKLGLHARPAAHFVKHVRSFSVRNLACHSWRPVFGFKLNRSSTCQSRLRSYAQRSKHMVLMPRKLVERLEKLLGELDRFD